MTAVLLHALAAFAISAFVRALPWEWFPARIASLRDKARRWRQKFSHPQCRACRTLVDRNAPECTCGAKRPDSGWPRQQVLVMIDYLQRIPVQVRPGGSDEKAVSDLSRQLKDLALELRCPVVALSQLNRKCEERKDKRPIPADLRDSGALEQDADLIIFPYRDEVYDPDTDDQGIIELILAKQRSGTTGTTRAVYLAPYGPKITNLSLRQPEFF